MQTEMSSPSTWKHKNGRKSEFDWASRRSSDRPCSSQTSFTRDRCWLTLVRYSLILPFLSASDSLASRPLIMRAVERRELTTDL